MSRAPCAGTKGVNLIAFLKERLPFIPYMSREWARQFVHEDDVAATVDLMLAREIPGGIAAFNVAPADCLSAHEIAAALGKRPIRVPVWVMRSVFTLAWNATRGRVPTPPGSINFYEYPINLDNRKLGAFGLPIARSSAETLLATV